MKHFEEGKLLENLCSERESTEQVFFLMILKILKFHLGTIEAGDSAPGGTEQSCEGDN